jgi:hypothetical protein
LIKIPLMLIIIVVVPTILMTFTWRYEKAIDSIFRWNHELPLTFKTKYSKTTLWIIWSMSSTRRTRRSFFLPFGRY